MFVVLCALWSGDALAQEGRLNITVEGVYTLRVDGTLQELPESGPYKIPVEPGSHELLVIKGKKKELYAGEVDVPPGHEVRCRFRQGAMDCYPPAPLVVATVPAATSAGTRPSEEAPVTEGVSMVVATMPEAPQGTGVVVYDRSGAVQVSDGISSNRAVTVGAGAEQGTTVVVFGERTGEVPERVKMVIRSLDGVPAGLYVDGQLAAELNAEGDSVVWIPPGVHTIEVRESGAATAWSAGTIDTGTAALFTLGVKRDTPIACFDHPGWKATP